MQKKKFLQITIKGTIKVSRLHTPSRFFTFDIKIWHPNGALKRVSKGLEIVIFSTNFHTESAFYFFDLLMKNIIFYVLSVYETSCIITFMRIMGRNFERKNQLAYHHLKTIKRKTIDSFCFVEYNFKLIETIPKMEKKLYHYVLNISEE